MIAGTGTAVLAIAAASLGAGGSAARGAVIFQEDFERGAPSGWTYIQQARPDAIELVTDVARDGAHSARFDVRREDRIPGDASPRAELAGTGERVGPGDRRVYSWSTFVPRDYPRSRRWQVITQWKNEGTGSPPLELDIIGDQFQLSASVAGRSRTVWRAPIRRGRWTDFSMHLRFSERGSDARIRLFRDGRMVVDRRGLPTLFRGKRSYWKLGLYRDSAIRAPATLYHDAVQVRAP